MNKFGILQEEFEDPTKKILESSEEDIEEEVMSTITRLDKELTMKKKTHQEDHQKKSK